MVRRDGLTVVKRGIPFEELGFADAMVGGNGVTLVTGLDLVEGVAFIDDAGHDRLVGGLWRIGRRRRRCSSSSSSWTGGCACIGGSGNGGLGLTSYATDHTVPLAGVNVWAGEARIQRLQVSY